MRLAAGVRALPRWGGAVSVSAVPRSALARWSALGGVAYVVLFVVGVILVFGGSPDSNSAPSKIIAYYSDSGHRDRINIGWILAGLGLFAFVWFVAALRQTIRRPEGDDGLLTAVTTIGGVVCPARPCRAARRIPSRARVEARRGPVGVKQA